ncbi:hypothetical protein AJ79_03796 [Helicocarpus griseus UAMH5409]|uniref:Uncharacterized protein n=1 Tax=Helicocarpus griseus UAMH5409 TaxID=1447875 RepID=A0A2B7XXM8_9EURO|nr:hypothetical protein AJ79_03796 [Helicocarpus griseus UAMH5409]
MNNTVGYPVRQVHVIKRESWTLSYKITTPDETSILYTVQTSNGHPEVTVIRHLTPVPNNSQQASSTSRLSGQFSLSSLLRAHSQQQGDSQYSNDYVVGTARFHSLSSKIDVNLSTNHAFQMKRPDPFSSTRRFESLTPLGTLEWRSDGGALGSLITSNLKLVDGTGRTVAKYEKGSGLVSRGSSTITMLVPELDGFLDIVIMSCMATIEYRRVENKAASEAVGGV